MEKQIQTLGVYIKMVNNYNKHNIGRFCVRFWRLILYPTKLRSTIQTEINKMCTKNGSRKIVRKSTKFSDLFNKNSASFEDSLVSTAVIEAATKSIKNNSSWQKISLKK